VANTSLHVRLVTGVERERAGGAAARCDLGDQRLELLRVAASDREGEAARGEALRDRGADIVARTHDERDARLPVGLWRS
jgi:hypothetical protein